MVLHQRRLLLENDECTGRQVDHALGVDTLALLHSSHAVCLRPFLMRILEQTQLLATPLRAPTWLLQLLHYRTMQLQVQDAAQEKTMAPCQHVLTSTNTTAC